MDLLLWRHAEAEDWVPGRDDMQRALTARGEKQAARMAAWLDRQLPQGARIWCSPARRCEQTVLALGRKYKLSAQIAPGARVEDLLQLAQWPQASATVLLVGHQPTLGRAAAQLLGLSGGDCPVKKGALWWLRRRDRLAHTQTVLVAVQSPELL